jgi:hypothetical protein
VGQVVAAARGQRDDPKHVPGSSGKTLEYSGQ